MRVASPERRKTLERLKRRFHGGEVVVVKKNLVHGGLLGADPLFQGKSTLWRVFALLVRGHFPTHFLHAFPRQSASLIEIMHASGLVHHGSAIGPS